MCKHIEYYSCAGGGGGRPEATWMSISNLDAQRDWGGGWAADLILLE
jgi:hypothetical protein